MDMLWLFFIAVKSIFSNRVQNYNFFIVSTNKLQLFCTK